MSLAIEVENLHYYAGNVPLLAEVTLAVGEGEYVSILGPNGAGKTTLLRCINRLLRPKRGTIRIQGRPVESYSPIELARVVGYVPQSDGRSFPFTVYEIVMMGRYPYLSPFSSPRPEDRDAVCRALAITETERFADRLHATLSGGEKQKVMIAAALAQEARILLLDEPTTFLDPKHQTEIFRLLQKINREAGVTILSVTHDINSAVLSSNRIVALKEGRCIFSGAPGQLMNPDVLRRLYDKEFLFVEHPRTGQRLVVPEGRT
ncbi:MAG: ABC transporter ATP-binding protein [Kiritimatiellae bacterium]|nr:ABC transporter ATP-binding protein [Kiritimatiellia bacterium]